MRTIGRTLLSSTLALTLVVGVSSVAAAQKKEKEHPPKARIPVVVALVDAPLHGDVPGMIVRRAGATPSEVVVMRSGEETPELLSELLQGVRVARDLDGAAVARTQTLQPRFEKKPKRMKGADALLQRLRASAPAQLTEVGTARSVTAYIADVPWKN